MRAVKEGGTVLGGGEQQPAEILQGPGLVQPANPDQVVAGVGDELPGGSIRRAVGGVEAAGPCPLGRNLAVQEVWPTIGSRLRLEADPDAACASAILG